MAEKLPEASVNTSNKRLHHPWRSARQATSCLMEIPTRQQQQSKRRHKSPETLIFYMLLLNYPYMQYILSHGFSTYQLPLWCAIYEVHTISFQIYFVQAFKIVVDSWKLSILLLYILWDNWPIFMTSGSKEQLQQQLEYTLLKSDCHSWWISKMQSDTL